MRTLINSNPSRSINDYLKVLFLLLFFILFINIFVSFLIISITKQQSIDYVKKIVNVYINGVSQEMKAVDHFMTWTVIHEPLIENVEEASDIHEISKNLHSFRTRVSDFQYSVGKKYQFFLILKNENVFTNTSDLLLPYSDYLELKNIFLPTFQNKETRDNESIQVWKSLELGDKFYLYNLIEYENRVFICLISADDILISLKDINLGNKGGIVLENEDQFYLSASDSEFLEEKYQQSFFKSHLIFPGNEYSLPFTLHIYLDHFSAFQKIVLVQMVTIVATALIGLTIILIARYLKNRVISPIQRFSKNLRKINENNERIDLESISIKELEEVNTQFKDLFNEIKKLKINIYEQEIEKKKIEMDFMKLQIKPHFYINCLTTIYNMAELHLYEEIKEMALSTTKYFRYLFQVNQDFVVLEKELDHVHDYLSIQKLLHGHLFHFESFIEPGLEKAKIPPLLLQTFIENSVKYAVSIDDDSKINLEIKKLIKNNKDLMKITIKDNGPGFPPEILNKLQNRIPLSNEEGKQIGINNVIQRLQQHFDGESSVEFSNGQEGSAIVEVIIPLIKEEETNECITC